MTHWNRLTKGDKPEPHVGVLVRTMGAGPVYDVACYVGRQPDGSDRWIMADIMLDPERITHWSYIEEPDDID